MSNGRQVLLRGIRLGGSAIGGIRAAIEEIRLRKPFSKLKIDNPCLQKVRTFVCEVI